MQVENIYAVFGDYQKPPQIPACPCCMPENEIGRLHSSKLRDLTADGLSEYAASVFLTVGSLPDYKYFLPRILELSASDDFSWPSPEVVLRSLKLADWQTWPAEEQQAITELLRARLIALLTASEIRDDLIDEWLCGICSCVDDITPYTDIMLLPAHRAGLLAYVEHNLSSLPKNRLLNPFWEEAKEKESAMIQALRNDDVAAYLSSNYGMAMF